MELQSLPWYGQLLVFLIIGGILIGIFYTVYYSDGQEQIKSLDSQIDAIEKEIKRAEKKQEKLKNIEEELERKKEVLEELKQILPEEKEISQILKKIQGLISGARMRISTFDPGSGRNREIYVQVPISIILDGNYHNLGVFFDQLSKLKKIFIVDGLKLTPIARMTNVYTVRANFTASTYIYREMTAKERKASKRRRRQ